MTTVIFGDRINLTANAMVKIDGVQVMRFWIDSNALHIGADITLSQVIEIKSIKYPDLFPSYNFTFTVNMLSSP